MTEKNSFQFSIDLDGPQQLVKDSEVGCETPRSHVGPGSVLGRPGVVPGRFWGGYGSVRGWFGDVLGMFWGVFGMIFG